MKELITIIICMVLTQGAYAQWSTITDEDEMTGEKSSYASSPKATPTKTLSSPYSDLSAVLVVGCDSETEWVYLILNTDANLNYNVIREDHKTAYTNVKWDDEIKEVILTQYDNHRALDFYDDETVITDIQEHNTALVELNWYSEGRIFLRFNLSGSTNAINKNRINCNGF